MARQWTDEQTAIIRAVQDGESLMAEALAGTGKTSTLVEATKGRRGLLCAFNVSIRDELLPRVGEEMTVRTIHQVGSAAIGKAAKGRPEVYGQKYRKLALAWLETKRRITERDEQRSLADKIKAMIDMARLDLLEKVDDDDALLALARDREIDLGPAQDRRVVLDAVAPVLQMGQTMMRSQIDFTDMLYLPVKLGLDVQQFPLVGVDEAQDLSAAQLALTRMATMPFGQRVYIGDRNQCQPPDTLVQMADGTWKRIEHVRPGDEVVTYDRKSGAYVRKGRVTEVAERDYDGTLYQVRAGGQTTQCTDSHKWMVRWCNLDRKAWVTYVMRQGSRYRVGMTKMFLDVPAVRGARFGLAARCRQERADAAWVLRVHDNFADALAYEQIVSTRYGLPQVVFFPAWGIKYYTADMIEEIYRRVGDLREKAVQCLEDHGRLEQYPLYSAARLGEQQRQGRTTLFETQACNLIPSFMAVPVPPPTFSQGDDTWHPVDVRTLGYEGRVHSLNVGKHHKYVADGLLTCNSIYAFAGADANSFQNIVDELAGKVYPMTISWRSPKVLAEMAQQYVPTFRVPDEAAQGRYEQMDRDSLLGHARPGMRVMCRVTAELVEFAFGLLMRGTPAFVLGRDIAGKLRSIVDDTARQKGFDMAHFEQYLDAYHVEAASAYDADDDKSAAALEALADRVRCVRVIWGRSGQPGSPDALKAAIDTLIPEKARPEEMVECATIHKNKGRENHLYIRLRPDLIPHPMAKTEVQRSQERNLAYVSLTRAKDALVDEQC